MTYHITRYTNIGHGHRWWRPTRSMTPATRFYSAPGWAEGPGPDKSGALHQKRRIGLICLPNRMVWAFLRVVLVLRPPSALLEQPRQFSGDVVDLGLDIARLACLAFARCCIALRVDGRDWLDAQLKRIG